MFSEKILKAKRFACEAHEGQKYGEYSYDKHLCEVAGLANYFFDDEEVIIASWLHDTIEDTKITFENIEAEFGTTIADAVSSVTKTKDKEETLKRISSNAIGTKVKVCDRYANMLETFVSQNKRLALKYTLEYPTFRETLLSCETAKIFKKIDDIYSDLLEMLD